MNALQRGDVDSHAAAEDAGLPLLPRTSLDGGLDAEASAASGGASYGAFDHQNDASDALPTSSPAHVDHCIVNHAHPYSDAAVDAVIIDGDEPRDGSAQEEIRNISYWTLVRDNPNYRWYLTSYLVTHAGEWFTYVASIAAIEQIHSAHNITSRTSISILVSLRLLPNALFTSIGGVLADSYDRRTMLWVLDLLGSAVALLFLMAYQWRSIPALYAATALQMTVAALYEPNRSSIVPMLVKDEESLKKANIVAGLAWSSMTAVGSSLGGFGAEWLGIPACFGIDSASYLASAMFIWKMKGSYRASEMETSDAKDNSKCGKGEEESTILSPSQFTNMFREGLAYLHSNAWGAFVFFKCCAALIFGAADVLNVSFSERSRDGDDGYNMEGSSERLGMLFAFVGVGCFLGPIVIDHFTHMDDVSSLERACLGSFLLMAVGCYGLSWAESFGGICAFTAIRSAGSSVVWIYSSLLLQKFSRGDMLGRVMSVDYSIATLSEAFSAMCGGMLQDDAGLTAEQVSFLMSLVALLTLVLWAIYLAVVRV